MSEGGSDGATVRLAARLTDIPVGRLLLRAVRDSDGPALTRIIAAAYDEFACGPLDPGGFDADLVAPAAYARERHRRWWVVTTPDDVPVASVAHGAARVAADAPATVELHRLYLAPAVRGRGLAGQLVTGIAAEAGRLGAQRLVAWSDTRLVAAHTRYVALGFTRSDASRELGDPAGTTEVRFDLALGG